MDMDTYINNKIESMLGQCSFFGRIHRMRNLIENCSLTNAQKLDLKLELLIAGRQCKDDSEEIKDKLSRRLQIIDNRIPNDDTRRSGSPLEPNSPFSMGSPRSDIEYDIEIDETKADKTLTAVDSSDASDTESTGTYGSINIDETQPLENIAARSSRRGRSESVDLFSDTSSVSSGHGPWTSENMFPDFDTSRSSRISASPEALIKRMKRK